MEDREPTLSTGSRGQRPWRMQPSTNRLVGSIVPSKTDRSFLTLQARPRSNSRSQEAGVGDGSQSRRGVTMRKRRLRLLVRYLFPTLEYLRRTPRGAKSLGSQLERRKTLATCLLWQICLRAKGLVFKDLSSKVTRSPRWQPLK